MKIFIPIRISFVNSVLDSPNPHTHIFFSVLSFARRDKENEKRTHKKSSMENEEKKHLKFRPDFYVKMNRTYILLCRKLKKSIFHSIWNSHLNLFISYSLDAIFLIMTTFFVYYSFLPLFLRTTGKWKRKAFLLFIATSVANLIFFVRKCGGDVV